MISKLSIDQYVSNLSEEAQIIYSEVKNGTNHSKIASAEVIKTAMIDNPSISKILLLKNCNEKLMNLIVNDFTIEEVVDAISLYSNKNKKFYHEFSLYKFSAFKLIEIVFGVNGKSLARLRSRDYSAYLETRDALFCSGIYRFLTDPNFD